MIWFLQANYFITIFFNFENKKNLYFVLGYRFSAVYFAFY